MKVWHLTANHLDSPLSELILKINYLSWSDPRAIKNWEVSLISLISPPPTASWGCPSSIRARSDSPPLIGVWPLRAHSYLFNLQPKKEAFHLGRPLKNSWCRRSESLRLAQDRLPDTGWEPRWILRWRSYESSLQEHPMITFYRIGKGCLSCIWTYPPLVRPLVVPGGLNLVWQSLFSVHFLWTYKNILENLDN